MPNHDITIYGEWGLQNDVFEPKITKEIINKKQNINQKTKYHLK